MQRSQTYHKHTPQPQKVMRWSFLRLFPFTRQGLIREKCWHFLTTPNKDTITSIHNMTSIRRTHEADNFWVFFFLALVISGNSKLFWTVFEPKKKITCFTYGFKIYLSTMINMRLHTLYSISISVLSHVEVGKWYHNRNVETINCNSRIKSQPTRKIAMFNYTLKLGKLGTKLYFLFNFNTAQYKSLINFKVSTRRIHQLI